MTPSDLRSRYLRFFVERGHKEIPSAPLVLENDPTTLFTSSGMQPLVPYLLGQPHALGKRLVDSQKSFRSQDIEEVGDNRHTTFFEMLGNWSLGDYFKKEQLGWCFEFLVKELKLDPKKLYVTVFRGNDLVPKDTESVEIWKALFKQEGIEAVDVDTAEKIGMNNGRIFYYDEKKNWWSRSGVPSAMPAGELGGPDSEVFYDFGAELLLHEHSQWKDLPCHVNCDCGRFLEIGNSVFMQYQKQVNGTFKELPQRNVDFGGGLERILAALNGNSDVFTTEAFKPLIEEVEKQTEREYAGDKNKRSMRVIADHLKASTFLIVDGILPSNKAQGYVLRRLLRRVAIKFYELDGIIAPPAATSLICEEILCLYDDLLDRTKNRDLVKRVVENEMDKFQTALEKGMKVLEKTPEVDGKVAFDLYQSYGFPLEVTIELALQKGQQVDAAIFKEEFQKHQELSRTSSKGMFKGGLANHSEVTTKYHTATHLLQAALRQVLGEHVHQEGSNITEERLRFDFSHPKPMTEEEKKQVENLVNEKIKESLPVTKQTIPKEEALAAGAMAFFREKYPDIVTVYTIGKDPASDWFSKELCGGPHVSNTSEIGPIKITREESIGSGHRRIYLQRAS